MPDTNTDGYLDRSEIHPGVFIEDAHINHHVKAANSPELIIQVSDKLLVSEIEPIVCDPDNAEWIVNNGYGVYFGWQDTLPVSEETGMAKLPVTHITEGRVTDRWPMLSHMVVLTQHQRSAFSAFEVHVEKDRRHIGSYALHPEIGAYIIREWVNGDRGSDTRSYWKYAYTKDGRWDIHSKKHKSLLEEADRKEVTLTAHRDWGWEVTPIEDLQHYHSPYEERGDMVESLSSIVQHQ